VEKENSVAVPIYELQESRTGSLEYCDEKGNVCVPAVLLARHYRWGRMRR
jgi:hypothetical protein